MVNCAPAVAGNHTFVSGCDSHLRVIDVVSGMQVTDIPLGIYMIASPAVVDNMLYVGTHGGEVLAIDWQKAQTVWTYRGVAKEASVQSSCAVTEDYVLVGAQDKRLHCIARQTGEQVWVFSAKRHIDSSPAVVGNRVYVGSQDGNLYGIELSTGKEVFRYADGRPISASPAVGEGCLVIGSESATGTLYCFGAPR
jgi:outer membrane protein assembly factor BamB